MSRSQITGETIRRCPLAGFSLVEVLIAMLLTTVLMVAILSLFSQSLVHGAGSAEIAEVTARAEERLEEVMALSFDSPLLEVPVGESERLVEEAWVERRQAWLPAAQGGPPGASLLRTTRIRQFDAAEAVQSGVEVQLGEALAGADAGRSANLKEIEVSVWSLRSPTGRRGPAHAVTLRLLRCV